MRSWAALFLASFLASAAPVTAIEITVYGFQDLNGWAADDHSAALTVFQSTCDRIQGDDWSTLCSMSAQFSAAPRQFFELFFRPVLIGGPQPALFTGYYEPEIEASATRSSYYTIPVYSRPPDMRDGARYLSRAQIDASSNLAQRGLAIAWLHNPADLYFLQIQGSGRLVMQGGHVLRLGYAGQNGHPRRSVGVELARQGIFNRNQVSAAVIRNWVLRNPARGRSFLHHDPSYVFFRVLSDHPSGSGPIGAMSRALTPLRSIAVDPDFTRLGAPVWMEKNGAGQIHRLMIAQDTGGAIQGPQRADIFFGTGETAGQVAGTIHDAGRMLVLLPIERAFAAATTF
jgi:membrane-bound lytic murein transglycosylase A